jgi:DNA-binding transcriptional ArsR family regulator
MNTATSRNRARAARGLSEILDSKLFKALCEPVRCDILKILTARGRSNVGAIAEQLPQDGSVVSRHLAILADAGVVRRAKEGRQVFFELDGPGMVDRMEKIVERFRAVVPLCCPMDED